MTEQLNETIRAGARTYFIDLKETKENKPFLVLTESRYKGEEKEHERTSIAIFPEYAQSLLVAFEKMVAELDS
jgi:hypothetical protein